MSRTFATTVIVISLLLLAVVFAYVLPTSAQSGANGWESKVDPLLMETLRSAESTEFLIIMDDQLDLSSIPATRGKADRAQYVYDALTAHAEETQADVRRMLDEQGVAWRNLWISNSLVVTGTIEIVRHSAEFDSVAHIAANPHIYNPPPETSADDQTTRAVTTTWGIERINADDVWLTLGITGTGAIVGGQDTGYDWEHPGLKNQYRGWDGTTADHNYNWHDSIHALSSLHSGGTNPCGLDSPIPCDDGSHGTHTMGTMVGNDEGGTSVGVAPGAEWMGCRNMERGWGQPSTYIECFQWFVAPTDLSGSNPDVTKAPHVINNSWHCPTVEGCSTATFSAFETAISNLRSSGVVVVSAASNNGNSCSTVRTPPAMFNSSFAVGSLTSSGSISSFSSFGPVTADGSNLMKPDITAPGSSVLSTVPNGYSSFSGTSMAAPHIAGVVALMISAQPELAGQVDTIENILRTTAVPRTPTTLCGTDTSASVPNNVFGAGEVDAYAAVVAAQQTNTAVTGVQLATANQQSDALPLLIISLALLTLTTAYFVKSQAQAIR